MDALTSQALCAGYRASLVAAELSPKFFPLLMTAAGTVTPAKVWGVLQKMLDEKYPEGWCGIKEDAAKRVIFGRF